MGRKKKYLTEEERKAANREYQKQWCEKHRDKLLEYQKQWSEKHRDKRLEYQKQWREAHQDNLKQYRKENKDRYNEFRKQYRQTPIGRATSLVHNYKLHDKKNQRGECTLTPEWVVENIFTQPCRYCGETDWKKLGCDRIDNDKPHTPDNVVCCCWECNVKKGRTPFEEYLKKIII